MKTIEAAGLALMLIVTIVLIWAAKTEPCGHTAEHREPVVARSCEMTGRAPERDAIRRLKGAGEE